MAKTKNITKELRRQNTVLNKKIDEYKDREDFSKAIKIETLENLDSLTVQSNSKFKEEVIPVTLLSDIHIEEEVVKAIVNGLNMYNLDVAKLRIEKYFSRLIYMLRQIKKAGYKYDKLVLGLLGDNITGYIHEELEETNLLTPPQAVLFVQDLLVRGIKTLSELGIFNEILIPSIPGNHGRTTKRKRFTSGYKNSYEWLMYNEMQRIFSETKGYNNVKFIIAESEYLYLDLFGYINIFSHGDHFNYQGGIGGIEVPMKKWILRENSVATANPAFNDRGIDMAWIAHWHQYIVSNKIRCNGSVIGYNSYARSFGFQPEEPKMQFQLLDKKRGYTLNNPIYLNDF